jgi:hypothetical protein
MKNRKIVMYPSGYSEASQKGLKDLQSMPIAVWTKSLKAFPPVQIPRKNNYPAGKAARGRKAYPSLGNAAPGVTVIGFLKIGPSYTNV